MSCCFDFRIYQRSFPSPLITHYGSWTVREGIILRLTDEAGNTGWGEIAPLPWFGSETLPQARKFLQSLDGKLTEKKISTIPAELPACQFGLESAWEDRFRQARDINKKGAITYSYLLPAGKMALQSWQEIWKRGGRRFKWKIGVISAREEMSIFEKLTKALPPEVKIRLDANGGLSFAEAKAWLELVKRVGMVEFIEQPLPPAKFEQMLSLSKTFPTPIALDESVATLPQLEACYQEGWRGIYVIKAAIVGSPQRLRHFCHQYKIDAVFSSVFETKIGREAALHLAAELSNPNRAIGFGVENWFLEDEDEWLKNLWKDC